MFSSTFLNIKKTKVLILNFRFKQDVHLPLRIGGQEVEQLTSFKFLGTHISSNLKCEYEPHCCREEGPAKTAFPRDTEEREIN